MIRLQTTRESASTNINGVRFAPHPNPPGGGRVMVSEPVDERDDNVQSLLAFGFERAPAYAADVVDAIDAAIDREVNSARSAATAASDKTVEELTAANQNMARQLADASAEVHKLKRQVGESAVAEKQAEIERLQGRLREAEEKGGAADAAVVAENARLRETNATLGTELGDIRKVLATATGQVKALTDERDQLAKDLAAAQKDQKGAAKGK